MEFQTERLVLRPWKESDAESLYKYAKDPKVGPIAGWPVHTSVENSRDIIKNVLAVDGTYAVCLKTDNMAVGSVGLMIGKQSNLEIPETEGEIGYWIGVPFWGQGLIPEAVTEMIRYGFENMKLDRIWCGYFDGNVKSKRVQEKCGFVYHHTNKDIQWKLMNDVRTEHITCMTRKGWLENSKELKMSEVMEKILTRRSIRKYKPDMVPMEDIEKVIKAGTYAASGRGFQAPVIIAVTNKEVRDKLSKLNAKIMGAQGTDPFYGAPVVLIVLANRKRATYLYDGSLVIGNMMLAAHDLGLGSCWIHRAKEEFETDEGRELLKSLGIKGDYEGIGHCILGYIDGDYPKAAPRKQNHIYYIN